MRWQNNAADVQQNNAADVGATQNNAADVYMLTCLDQWKYVQRDIYIDVQSACISACTLHNMF